MEYFITLITICRSALLTLLIVTTLVQIRKAKGDVKWYSLLFILALLVLDL